jgi:hypothetical protein
VTDQKAVQPDWLPRLRTVIRGSAHETRNALNGIVVNLEVVRSRLARAADGSPETLPFAEQAMGQVEESVRLSEAVGSLLLLISSAVDSDGRVRCVQGEGELESLRFEVGRGTADRTLPGLRTLGKALGFGAETDGGTVILSFPQDSSPETRISE